MPVTHSIQPIVRGTGKAGQAHGLLVFLFLLPCGVPRALAGCPLTFRSPPFFSGGQVLERLCEDGGGGSGWVSLVPKKNLGRWDSRRGTPPQLNRGLSTSPVDCRRRRHNGRVDMSPIGGIFDFRRTVKLWFFSSFFGSMGGLCEIIVANQRQRHLNRCLGRDS